MKQNRAVKEKSVLLKDLEEIQSPNLRPKEHEKSGLSGVKTCRFCTTAGRFFAL